VTIARATLLFAGYTLITLALTHPIAWHLAQVPHDLGDPLLSTVLLWWNAHHLPLTAHWWNGSFFVPATGVVSFSDHRLGESLLASPLQWLGLAPLAATNVTLLATFPLCALAAHWLAFTLTERHDASAIAGMAYGFSPFRFGHLEHLELLAAFGMPIALVALHRYLTDRRTMWWWLFGGALVLQALACSYYFLFFLILLALWILWFVRLPDVKVVFGAAAGVALAAVAISPVAVKYLAIHERFGMTRILAEIVTLSADVTSIVTAPPASVLWGWTSTLNGPERQLFPGATVLVLVAAGFVAAARTRSSTTWRANRLPIVLVGVGVIFILIAAHVSWNGPTRFAGISIGTPFKTLTLAFWALVFALLTSARAQAAFSRRSTFAFYVLASAAMFLLALGPAPAFLHRQILYEPPYAWLMRLNVFGQGVRVPARFGMLMILTLAVSAAIAFACLVKRESPRSLVLAAVLCLGIAADAWIRPVPMFAAPAAWPSSVPTAGVASILELPLGDTTRDVVAMYRSVLTGIPTVNGYSGYFPPHYEPLRLALDERDETALDVLAARGPLLVVVDRAEPYARERIDWLRSLRSGEAPRPAAREVASDDQRAWFLVHGTSAVDPVACGDERLAMASARDWRGPVSLATVTDGNDATFWSTGESQRAGDALVIDLGAALRPCSVRVTLGSHRSSYPRALSVATSVDAERWEPVFDGKLGGAAVAAALARPLDTRLELPLPNRPTRYIRLETMANQPNVAWLVTELAVTASKPE
jgi:F5/8 type C domain-containing protein